MLIAGADPIVDLLCSALEPLGRTYRRVEALDADVVRESRSTAVVLVEPLPRVGAPAPPQRDLRELVASANAPGIRTAILVTPRPDDDPELRAVRRSGIPYTILRPLPIVEGGEAKPILVARELAQAPATAVTAAIVVDAVLGVLDGSACGQTLAVAPPADMTWSELLSRAGAKPRSVASWRARVGRWFGARTLDVAVA